MQRFKLTIEYDGTAYAGWQCQKGIKTIQSAIEQAVFSFCGEKTRLTAAGRTDAGVHAHGQVAHLDLQKKWPAHIVQNAINSHLLSQKENIAIIKAHQTSKKFDARFCAVERHYLYRIINRRPPLILEANRAWGIIPPLDHEAMNEAAQYLVGKNDFSTFRASLCQSKSPIKTLNKLEVHRQNQCLEIKASALSFLHNQVRSMVGSLVEVGRGKWQPQRVLEALEVKDRSACGPVAPPHGLYLVMVSYPKSKS